MSYVISNNRTCDKCSQFKNAKHQTIFRWCNIFRFCLETKKKLSSSSQNIRSDKTGGEGEGKEEKIIFFFFKIWYLFRIKRCLKWDANGRTKMYGSNNDQCKPLSLCKAGFFLFLGSHQRLFDIFYLKKK